MSPERHPVLVDASRNERGIILAYRAALYSPRSARTGATRTARRARSKSEWSKPVQIPIADYFRREHGKVAEHWGVTDTGIMKEQLGAS